MNYIPQQQYQQFQQMPGASMPVQQRPMTTGQPLQQHPGMTGQTLQQYPGNTTQPLQQHPGMTGQPLQQYPGTTAQPLQQRVAPNQYRNVPQNNVPAGSHYKQPKQKQKHHHNPYVRAAPGMIAGTAAATAIANTIPMPGHGFSRTAGRLAAGLFGGHYVAKGVNKQVNKHF